MANVTMVPWARSRPSARMVQIVTTVRRRMAAGDARTCARLRATRSATMVEAAASIRCAPLEQIVASMPPCGLNPDQQN